MYSNSRGVLGAAAFAFSTASHPCFNADTSKGKISGLERWLIARPQYPMVQVGSVLVTAVNAFTVSGKKKECSSATARSNCCCAAAVQETGKWTFPSCSG